MTGSLRFRSRGVFALTLVALLILMGTASMSQPEVASAHPLGNFTINRYSRIEAGIDQINLTYVLDLAEIPAFQEMSKIDTNRDGQASDGERAAYLAARVEALKDGMNLTVNDSPIALEPVSRELSFPPGQGGLPTLRLGLLLRGQWRQDGRRPEQTLYYRDDNYSQRLGWREIIVTPGEGVSLLASNVSREDRSNQLRSYPDDMLSSPPEHEEARSTFVVAAPGQAGELRVAPATTLPAAESRDFITSLVTAQTLSLPVIALALAVALGLGGLHAMSPGHGKTIMAAYLVGTRGTAIHAVFLGLTVTVSHTLGVLGLGLVTLYASHLVTPERIYPWLGLVSGGMILIIGAWLLAGRIRDRRPASIERRHPAERHLPARHRHPANGSGSGREAPYAGHGGPSAGSSWLALLSRALRSIVRSRLIHSHSHDHDHHHDQDHSHGHDHARHPAHSPSPRGNSALRVTWRNLAALGIAGGLIPSASALVILLAAVSLNRVGFGLILILAFSAGMAGVLAGIGLFLVYTRQLVERFQAKNRLIGSFTRTLPLATALIVLVSGMVITARAVFQAGLL